MAQNEREAFQFVRESNQTSCRLLSTHDASIRSLSGQPGLSHAWG